MGGGFLPTRFLCVVMDNGQNRRYKHDTRGILLCILCVYLLLDDVYLLLVNVYILLVNSYLVLDTVSLPLVNVYLLLVNLYSLLDTIARARGDRFVFQQSYMYVQCLMPRVLDVYRRLGCTE